MHIITWYKTTGTNIRPVSVLLLLGLCLFVFFALHLFFTVFTHGTLYYSIHVCVCVCLFVSSRLWLSKAISATSSFQ